MVCADEQLHAWIGTDRPPQHSGNISGSGMWGRKTNMQKAASLHRLTSELNKDHPSNSVWPARELTLFIAWKSLSFIANTHCCHNRESIDLDSRRAPWLENRAWNGKGEHSMTKANPFGNFKQAWSEILSLFRIIYLDIHWDLDL